MSVDRYLDTLFDRLAGTGADGRRTLAEAEDHLLAAVEEGVARGLDREAAERAAVARFGPARLVAAAVSPARTTLVTAVPRLVVAAWALAGAVLLVYGVSGVLTWALGWPYARLLADHDAFGTVHAWYTDDAGARHPIHACDGPYTGPCVDVGHGTLVYLGGARLDLAGFLVAGAAGAAVLALLALARRYTRVGLPAWTPPRRPAGFVAAAAFGLAAAVLLANGAMGFAARLQSWWLAYAVTGVVCAASAGFAWRWRRTLQVTGAG